MFFFLFFFLVERLGSLGNFTYYVCHLCVTWYIVLVWNLEF